MPMSADRVEFKLDTSSHAILSETLCRDYDATRIAYQKAFGVQMPSNKGQITIRCRPSQFARFLIYREEAGGRNSFKILEAKLVPMPPEPPRVIDVSHLAFSS